MTLSKRERKLLDDYHIVDLKPGEPQPKMTWRDKLRFHRYLKALLKQSKCRYPDCDCEPPCNSEASRETHDL